MRRFLAAVLIVAAPAFVVVSSQGASAADPARMAFRDLWDARHAKRGFGWAADPWVWALVLRLLTVRVPAQEPQQALAA